MNGQYVYEKVFNLTNKVLFFAYWIGKFSNHCWRKWISSYFKLLMRLLCIKTFPETYIYIHKKIKHVPDWIHISICISSVQSFSPVWLFATPWITARQASLSITSSRSSLRLTSIELVMPSSHLILCRPLLLLPPIPPSIRIFSMSQLFTWCGQCTGVSLLASFLPKKSQGWSPSEWTGWISLQSKGLSRVFSNTTVQKHQFFGTQLSSQSNSHIHTWPLEKP